MHAWLSLSFLLLVPGWAHADEPSHGGVRASDAVFAHRLDASVAETLNRSVDEATGHAVSALEARVAACLGQLERSAAQKIEEGIVAARGGAGEPPVWRPGRVPGVAPRRVSARLPERRADPYGLAELR